MDNVKKTELKVTINCQKCKSDLLKVVAKFHGVDGVTLNAEKGTITVIGTVDPVCLAAKIRKERKYAEILSVGPNKKPEPAKEPEKKPDCKPCDPLPPCCKQCQLVYVNHTYYSDGGCSIM